MKQNAFSSTTSKSLKSYVYLYLDPRDGSVFYVGKGQGNRCFSHLSDTRDTKKVEYILDLRKLGHEPKIEILRHGLSGTEALQVESAVIDLLGLDQLTNRVLGHGSSSVGRSDIDQLCAIFDAKPIEISHKAILININKNFMYGMSVHELYDATRCAWKINPDRHDADYAMSVYRGVIREVFEIQGWVKGGTTLKISDTNGRSGPRPGRWEFVGQVAEDIVRGKYLGRSVAKYWKKGAQNPILYVNC